jgi:hypothetical protein
MKFRWVAAIALYTFLIGPVFDHPGISSYSAKQTPTSKPEGRFLLSTQSSLGGRP